MWRILIHILVIIGLSLALFTMTKILSIPHVEYYTVPDLHLYNKGNASPEIRQQILDKLQLFQEGYEARDTSNLESYMDKLFSRENILILGTMPNEIYSGYSEAADLVSSDWLYWGDVKLLVEQSNISAMDSVAWVSTIGKVEFDLSRWLVLPLRFTGVMVNEGQDWKFQQVQFQLDLDSSWILGAILIISLLILASIIRLVFLIIRKQMQEV